MKNQTISREKFLWRFGFNDFEEAEFIYDIGAFVADIIGFKHGYNIVLNNVNLKRDGNLIYIETPKWKTNYFNTLGVIKIKNGRETDITKKDFEDLKFAVFDELKVLLM